MLILGIESSCDETAAAIVKDGREVLSNVVFSQIDIHKAYGGVVPEVAARNHIYWIDKVVDSALKEAKVKPDELAGVAVSVKTGLIGCVLVGESFAKAFALALNLPLIPINHVHAHIASGYLIDKNLTPPFIALVVSGGHTQLHYVSDYDEFELLASTEDDALGEAFDKAARVLGLGYPGGIKMDELTEQALRENAPLPFNSFYKKPRLVNKDFLISFSGLKTAFINHINSQKQKGHKIQECALALVFTKDAIDSLLEFTMLKAKERGAKKLLICGGVGANTYLRREAVRLCEQNELELFIPPNKYCGDNGAMVASNGYYKRKKI